MTSSRAAVVREPKQARSREAWERALDVGRELLEEGGIEALTISEVCRRSNMSPPSLYARVDGLAGLFAAVYDRGMAQVAATEEQVFAGLPRPDATTRQRALDAAAAITDVFSRHAAFLRPIIGAAGREPALLRRGATESRRLLDHIVRALQMDTDTAEDIARSLYSECVVRTMYGDDFFTDRPESAADFQARIGRVAASRASA